MPESPFDFLKRHVKVSHETFEKFSAYANLLTKWQKKINLVGPDTMGDIWRRHFLDSLQLQNAISDLSKTIIDLGTGAGFPGMVLAIAGATDVHLIESDTKKILFLREVARITATSVSIHHCRIEDLPLPSAEIVVSRACQPLDNLLTLAIPYVSHGTICLFHKGKNYVTEYEEAKKKWKCAMSIIPSITDPHGVILELRHVGKRNTNDEQHTT